ncbi:hypothetical protein Pcinc_007950 [Petrolisthes cinctipes]|uniref:Uncharacterized protein n=1 Tax=Petrolisthes cinctipes TaxID=88211 RepID=A0AAE1KWE6_PETCI|nr:hypothetical protein Pcinc_007950 [Petrolisthes cinctipes]
MGGGSRAVSPFGTARYFTPAPCLDLGLQDYYQDRPLGLVEEPRPRLLLGYHSPQGVIDGQVWAEAGSFLGVGPRNRIEHSQTHGAPHHPNYGNLPSLHSHHQWRATAGAYLAQRMSQSRSQKETGISPVAPALLLPTSAAYPSPTHLTPPAKTKAVVVGTLNFAAPLLLLGIAPDTAD